MKSNIDCPEERKHIRKTIDIFPAVAYNNIVIKSFFRKEREGMYVKCGSEGKYRQLNSCREQLWALQVFLLYPYICLTKCLSYTSDRFKSISVWVCFFMRRPV